MTRLLSASVRSFGCACLILVGAAGCNRSEETPTTPTTTETTSFTIVFSGTLTPGGSQSFAFTLASGVPIRVSLGSLTNASGTPLLTPLTLTFGRPAGTGCGALHTVTTSPGLSTHISVFTAAGTYCVAITDTGQLSGSADFGVRITEGDFSSPSGAGTITYANILLPGGFTSRTFDASAAGTVTVFMDTISPSSVASLSLGIGFPRSDGGGCQLSQSFTATRGSQFSLPVEAGTYCVKLSDPGTLTELTQFSLRIQHP